MIIFVDASAIVSLYDQVDPNHLKAVSLSHHLTKEGVITVTSNFVFAEIVTILSKKIGKIGSIKLGMHMKDSFRIVRLSEEAEELAWDIFKRQTSKNVGFVDCTTFALFNMKVFDKAFSFDLDFKSNKIPLLV